MQILVISVGDIHIDGLASYAPKHQVVVVQSAAVPAVLDEFSAIVVAGAYGAVSPGRFELVQMLAGLDKPLLGIGIGYEVLCQTLGIDLDALAECAVGAQRIIPTDDGSKIFQGTDPLLVKEGQRWLVEELPKSCQVLARSDSGIEAFRHKKRPLIAIQQLPDDFTYPSDAKMVYANLFAALGK